MMEDTDGSMPDPQMTPQGEQCLLLPRESQICIGQKSQQYIQVRTVHT